ncbi:MAG: hypothetical protein KY439_01290 [Actinobacteria bacterium]|nr:hypothetical protein [Actinomycetota bacterium]
MTAPVRAPRQPTARPVAKAQLEVVRAERLADAARRRRVRRLAMAATVAGALCLFGVVVAHVVLTQNQFRLDQLRGRSVSQQAEYDRLRLQVAELESPRRIVADAQQRLGMITPPKVVYLTPAPEQAGDAAAPAGSAATAGTQALARTARPEAGSSTAEGWSTVKPHLAEG